MTIDCETATPGTFRHTLHIGKHTLETDAPIADGGEDAAPGPHDLFDASLASCKALTAMWYAKKQGWPLERVEAHVERDDSEERKGVYKLKVRLAFHGALDAAQQQKLHDVVGRCPVHKLMTSTEIVVETTPL